MRVSLFIVIAAFACLICSCSPPSEKKVHNAAEHTKSVTAKYIDHEYEKYDDVLKDRIKDLDNDIEKLGGVSAAGKQEAGDDLNSSIINLTTEREQLQGKLNLMKEKQKASQDMLDRHWNIYNQSLDSILNDMNAFLEPIKKAGEKEGK